MEDFETSEYEASQRLATGVSVVISVLALVGVVANAYVIWLLRSAAVFPITSVYMLNRCLADLLFLVPAPALAVNLSYMSWVFGDAICRLTMAQLHVCSLASYAFMITLSVDCMCVVTQRVDDSRSILLKILVTVIWATAITLAVPFLIIYGTLKLGHSTLTHCTLFYPDFWIHILDFVSIGCMTTTMVTSWVMVFMAATPNSVYAVPQENGSQAYTARQLLLALTITFTVCHLPYTLIQTLHFCQIGYWIVITRVHFLTNKLIFVNAAANPLVYLVVMRRSRRDSHQQTNSNPIALQETEEDIDL